MCNSMLYMTYELTVLMVCDRHGNKPRLVREPSCRLGGSSPDRITVAGLIICRQFRWRRHAASQQPLIELSEWQTSARYLLNQCSLSSLNVAAGFFHTRRAGKRHQQHRPRGSSARVSSSPHAHHANRYRRRIFVLKQYNKVPTTRSVSICCFPSRWLLTTRLFFWFGFCLASSIILSSFLCECSAVMNYIIELAHGEWWRNKNWKNQIADAELD